MEKPKTQAKKCNLRNLIPGSRAAAAAADERGRKSAARWIFFQIQIGVETGF